MSSSQIFEEPSSEKCINQMLELRDSKLIKQSEIRRNPQVTQSIIDDLGSCFREGEKIDLKDELSEEDMEVVRRAAECMGR